MAEKKGSTSKVHKREMKIEVRMGIDDQEVRDKITKTLTHALKDEGELAEELKTVQKGYKDKFKKLTETIEEARLQLDEGNPEMRDVVATFDFPNGKVTFKDKETGKHIKHLDRDLTDEDKQIAIGDETGEVPSSQE